MSRDTFEAKGEACRLTKQQIRNLTHAYENAEGLSLEEGGWQNDLSAVVETGGMIMWLLEQAFPDLFSSEVNEEVEEFEHKRFAMQPTNIPKGDKDE